MNSSFQRAVNRAAKERQAFDVVKLFMRSLKLLRKEVARHHFFRFLSTASIKQGLVNNQTSLTNIPYQNHQGRTYPQFFWPFFLFLFIFSKFKYSFLSLFLDVPIFPRPFFSFASPEKPPIPRAGFSMSEVQDFRELFLEADAGTGATWGRVSDVFWGGGAGGRFGGRWRGVGGFGWKVKGGWKVLGLEIFGVELVQNFLNPKKTSENHPVFLHLLPNPFWTTKVVTFESVRAMIHAFLGASKGGSMRKRYFGIFGGPFGFFWGFWRSIWIFV